MEDEWRMNGGSVGKKRAEKHSKKVRTGDSGRFCQAFPGWIFLDFPGRPPSTGSWRAVLSPGGIRPAIGLPPCRPIPRQSRRILIARIFLKTKHPANLGSAGCFELLGDRISVW